LEYPSLMPKVLDPYFDGRTEDTLFSALIKHPDHLALFFENAADDETWTENHEQLMGKMLDWLTRQTFNERLSEENYKRAARAIIKHYPVIKSFLPKNIVIKLKDGQEPFNGLLLSAASDFFRQLLIQASVKNSNELSFPQLTTQEFFPIGTYLSTGIVPDLKTRGSEEIIELIKRAKAWELTELVIASERMLKKYIDADNVFKMLARSKKEQWSHFTQHCVDFINQRDWQFKLSIPSPVRLAFEFLDFHEPTLNFFEVLRPLVTDIVCSGNLIEEPQFGLILNECSDLFALDISRTNAFSNQLREIPTRLQSLNLSECSWVTKDNLKQIMGYCSKLQELHLQKDTHLNYIFWGELTKFKTLTRLDLTNCDQLQDENLSVLLRGLNTLTQFSLSGCKQITEKGFLELGKNLSRLVKLNVSYSEISDTALVEIVSRCRKLTDLDISGCPQLTERGILAAVKNGFALQEINMAHCDIPQESIQEIRMTYPQLSLNA
jgi:hypothetical protein